ncbi:hypothetical protein STURO_v1c06000 [Spiroplasma turonicum]|nr:hypothetical protein STURO_v1c06000 [Spiroplasma turonicum]
MPKIIDKKIKLIAKGSPQTTITLTNYSCTFL